MISTPTWLSVAGPVTAQGSIENRSRSSFTPPQAATGSFAESTTAVSAVGCRALQDRFHSVSSEQAVAELEHDHVGIAPRHFGEHGAGERGTAVRRGGHDAEIGEDHGAPRARILESQNVPPQGDARGLEGIDGEASVAHARDDRGAAAVLPASMQVPASATTGTPRTSSGAS